VRRSFALQYGGVYNFGHLTANPLKALDLAACQIHEQGVTNMKCPYSSSTGTVWTIYFQWLFLEVFNGGTDVKA